MTHTKKLWIRELNCGHERATNVAFISRVYEKPKVGKLAYCRECCEESKILAVRESHKSAREELEKVMRENR